MTGYRGIITGITSAKSGVTLLARILGANAEPITQASLSAITYSVKNLDDSDVAVATGTLTISAVVFNSLQTGAHWDKDDASNPGPDGRAGYNFLATLAGSNFGTGDRWQVDVKFTLAGGAIFVQPFILTANEVYV